MPVIYADSTEFTNLAHYDIVWKCEIACGQVVDWSGSRHSRAICLKKESICIRNLGATRMPQFMRTLVL